MAERFTDRFIRRQRWLDKVVDPVQAAVGGFYRLLGRPGRLLKNLMHGTTPLGHPFHAAITDGVIGAWAVGVVADFVTHFGHRLTTQAGDIALAVGLVVALLAFVSGVTDYQSTYAHERQVATAHGLIMTTAIALDTVSLALRWWAGSTVHAWAVGLSTLGFLTVTLGGYLGGHLVFGIGTQVNRNAFVEGPNDFVAVGRAEDFPEGVMRRVDAGGTPALLVRRGVRLYGIVATCSHAGGPLDEGKLNGDEVTCPWHASVFCVTNGRVHGGPATFDVPAFTVREEDGRVEVKLAVPH